MGTAKAVEAGTADLEMNMTPMIDVVFQLIIFLMLANDMSRREIEDLVLPKAAHGVEDGGIGENRRVIVNLLANGGGGPPTLKVRGEEMDLERFRQVLRPEAQSAREPGGKGASGLFLLIRADTGARWQDVQWVMQACADPTIGIYKLQFATTNPTLQEGK